MEMIKVVMITQVSMIYTTASKKDVRNLILFKFSMSSNVNNVLWSQSIKQDTLWEKIQCSYYYGKSSDESDDSYDAEDENDVDCNIYQDLYSTSSSSHQSSRG